MTVEAMGLVLNHSRAKGTAKVVLLGIANHDGDGGSWPSIATLARYANATERSVQRAIEQLVELGEVRVHHQQGGTMTTPNDRRPNRYEITVSPVDNRPNGVTLASPRGPDGVTPVSQRGDAGVVHGVTPASPEPSLNHPEHACDASGRARPVDNSGPDGVAALRAAFAADTALDTVGGFTNLTDVDYVRLDDLVRRHGVDRLVRSVRDTRSPPRSVRAFFDRWSDLTDVTQPPPEATGPRCDICRQTEARCNAAQIRTSPEHRHEFRRTGT